MIPACLSSERTLLMWASLTPGAFSLTAETVNSSVSSESMNVVISAFLEPRPESVAVRLSSSR
jgi:hypothetical protein